MVGKAVGGDCHAKKLEEKCYKKDDIGDDVELKLLFVDPTLKDACACNKDECNKSSKLDVTKPVHLILGFLATFMVTIWIKEE